MKPASIIFALFTLAATGVAKKTCTPSFDYCASDLIDSKGFTEDDLKESLKGTDYENEDPMKILYHCKNPGIVGHPKLCSSGCKGGEEEGSHGC